MLDEHYLSQFPALRGRLVRAAARMLGGPADAEDVVQESYLRALEAGEGPGPESMQAWLTTVMQHLAIDRLRRDGWMQRWLRDAEGLASEAPSAETEAACRQQLHRALLRLRLREEKSRDEAGSSDAVFHVYRQALQDCDARVLFAMLRQPPARALSMSASAASETPRTVCQVMQMGGRLGLVLTLGGKVLCVLPLDARQTDEEAEAALSY
ncbi:RNA polymerase sigma-70 factor (ECF subfamily) [Variovorax sp. 1140]|uniref:sigma factor n=1 Tax=Variovorax atrisoli TaxID=3394203 RepID=UPI003399F409